MRSPSLTQKTRHDSAGRIISAYPWRGQQVDVFDSARNAILIIELFRDEGLEPEHKAQLLVRMLSPNPEATIAMAGDGLGDLLCTIVWDAFGLDITKDQIHASESEGAVFDWEEDAGRIKASLLQSYGLDWDDVSRRMSYSDVCALLGTMLEADTETPFQQAVMYRTAKPPTPNKYNKAECDAFEARRRHFALGGAHDAKTANDTTADMFAAMKRAAKGA